MLTLGLELISSETVALAELAKNSYDADATNVLIRVSGSLIKGEGVVEVLDDGAGMSPETVSGVWLEPATPSRRSRPQSPRGRRSLGEKGLGRFAVAKLAERVTLSTRPVGGPETELSINWSDFEDDEKYLDEIEIPWKAHEAEVFAADGKAARLWSTAIATHVGVDHRAAWRPALGHGTLLQMSGLRSDWTADLASDVERALERLVSPQAALAGAVSDFNIILDLPAPIATIGRVIGPPDELKRPHYRMDALVDQDGHAVLTVRLRQGDKATVTHLDLPGVNGTQPTCGPFDLHLLAWDRDRDALEEIASPGTRYQDVRQALNRSAGVSVYRDGFRVLPYGEAGNDWLGLDRRRIDSPSKRLSNNQVVGTVSISRDLNPGLFDQTNREGLVVGEPFADFRQLILELVAHLERRRADDRPTSHSPAKSVNNIFQPLQLDALRTAVSVRHDRELEVLVHEAELQIAERTVEVREVVARYQRLATLGQLVDKMVHEVGQPAASVRSAAVAAIEHIHDGRSAVPTDPCAPVLRLVEQELDVIRSQSRVTLEVLRRLAPFGGRRRGRPQVIVMEEAIRQTAELLRADIRKSGTQLHLPTTANEVTVDGTELQEIVLNLLSNSLYWVTRIPKNSVREISISVERNNDGSLSMIVSDSGPGVPPEDHARIFEPYFSTRSGGYGLGLSLAGEIVSEYYGGELELVSPGELGGATFRATLRRRIG